MILNRQIDLSTWHLSFDDDIQMMGAHNGQIFHHQKDSFAAIGHTLGGFYYTDLASSKMVRLHLSNETVKSFLFNFLWSTNISDDWYVDQIKTWHSNLTLIFLLGHSSPHYLYLNFPFQQWHDMN